MVVVASCSEEVFHQQGLDNWSDLKGKMEETRVCQGARWPWAWCRKLHWSPTTTKTKHHSDSRVCSKTWKLNNAAPWCSVPNLREFVQFCHEEPSFSELIETHLRWLAVVTVYKCCSNHINLGVNSYWIKATYDTPWVNETACIIFM